MVRGPRELFTSDFSKIRCGGFRDCFVCRLPVLDDAAQKQVGRSMVAHFGCWEEVAITNPTLRAPLDADLAPQEPGTVTERAPGGDSGFADAVLRLFRRR